MGVVHLFDIVLVGLHQNRIYHRYFCLCVVKTLCNLSCTIDRMRLTQYSHKLYNLLLLGCLLSLKVIHE